VAFGWVALVAFGWVAFGLVALLITMVTFIDGEVWFVAFVAFGWVAFG
jgi:hypothetical protein